MNIYRTAIYIKLLPLILLRLIHYGYDVIFNNTWNHLDKVFGKTDITIKGIGSCFEKVWKKNGRCQNVTSEFSDSSYSYAIKDCIFYKVAKLYTSDDIAKAICEADKCYWENRLKNSDISVKKEKEIKNTFLCKVEFRIV